MGVSMHTYLSYLDIVVDGFMSFASYLAPTSSLKKLSNLFSTLVGCPCIVRRFYSVDAKRPATSHKREHLVSTVSQQEFRKQSLDKRTKIIESRSLPVLDHNLSISLCLS